MLVIAIFTTSAAPVPGCALVSSAPPFAGVSNQVSCHRFQPARAKRHRREMIAGRISADGPD
jgi:hypothetical protein